MVGGSDDAAESDVAVGATRVEPGPSFQGPGPPRDCTSRTPQDARSVATGLTRRELLRAGASAAATEGSSPWSVCRIVSPSPSRPAATRKNQIP